MKLHHVGIEVTSIERQAPLCAKQLGLRQTSAVIHDPIQRADVQFWSDDAGAVSYEFIQPSSEDSPVRRVAKTGGGLAHLCFEVPDIRAAIGHARETGAIVVCEPVPAVAFENRLIAFLFFRGLGLVEFVEGRQA